MNEENEAEGGALPRAPRTTKPMGPEEIAELRRLEQAATPAPWARVWLDLPEPKDRRFLAEARNALPRVLDDLEEQKTLNAELHKGVCAGYAELLGRARRMEDALVEVKAFAKAIAVVHESAAVREKALAVEHRIASVLA